MARERNYTPPGVLVHQVFTDDLSAVSVDALVHISGPHTNVISEADGNLENGYLGTYSADDGIYVELPAAVRGSIIKEDATQVVIKNALLKYYENQSNAFIVPANSKNTITAGATLAATPFSFRTNGLFSRDPLFYDRDVRAGDVVQLSALIEGEPATFTTTIASLIPEQADGVVTVEPVADKGNSVAASAALLMTPDTRITLKTPTDWDAYIRGKGITSDIYTIRVVASGDEQTALFTVTSATGDNAVNIKTTEESGDYYIPLGHTDVRVEFDGSFVQGETFVLTADTTIVAPVIAAGGTFNTTPAVGQPREVTYIVNVTKGGKLPATAPTDAAGIQAAPTLSVQTADGSDKIPLVRVLAKGEAAVISRYGITLTCNSDYLVTGDKFYITANTPYTAKVQSFILNQNLPAAWVSAVEQTVGLSLYLVDENLEVPQYTMTSSGKQANWVVDQDEASIQVRANLLLYTPSWTLNGEPLELPVFGFEANNSGKAYLEAVYYVSDLVGKVTKVNSLNSLNSTISGPIDKRNPLKLAAYHAIAAGAGSSVLLTSVADPNNIQEWERVTDLISDRDDVFHVFPLTQGNQQVINLFYQHTQISNQDEVARERVLYLASGDIPTKAILTDYFGNTALGKLTVEQSVGTSSYLAYSAETEGIDFNKLGLRPGDEIRTRFDYDAAGNEIYTSYKVDSVINSGMVRLVGKTDGVNEDQIPLRFEIWRTETNDEFADSIANTANCSGYLVRYIRADNANPDFDQIQAAAGLIGLIGSVVPHQGVSWYEIPGLSATDWVPQFSKTQLDHMAGNGVIVIVEMDGAIVARHAVTANKSPLVSDARTNLSAKLCEEMWIRNMLLLKKEFRSVVRRGYVGVTNMVSSTYTSLQHALNVRASILENSVDYPQLGGRISGGLTDLIIQPHAILADRLWISFHVAGPLPMNGLDMTIYC